MPTMTGDDMVAAQIVIGGVLVLWLLAGRVPALQPHAGRIRGLLLVVFLLAAAALVLRAVLRE